MRRAAGIVAGVAFAALFGLMSASPAAASDERIARFAGPAFNVDERASTFTVTVARPGGLDAGPATVDFATVDGTATTSADYISTSGTLIFGVGDTVKTFTVRVIDDRLSEPAETVYLSLSNPRGALTAVGDDAVLTILDDDLARAAAARNEAAKPSAAASTVGSASAIPQASVTRRTITQRTGRVTASSQSRPAPHAAATTFELKRPTSAFDATSSPPPAVDGVLVTLAALLLGRVAAGVWFQHRRRDATST